MSRKELTRPLLLGSAKRWSKMGCGLGCSSNQWALAATFLSLIGLAIILARYMLRQVLGHISMIGLTIILARYIL